MENEKWIIDNYIMACHFIADLTPHRGLDPRSAANINTEIPRHRDYNKKKTLLLCVSVFI